MPEVSRNFKFPIDGACRLHKSFGVSLNIESPTKKTLKIFPQGVVTQIQNDSRSARRYVAAQRGRTDPPVFHSSRVYRNIEGRCGYGDFR